MKRILNTNLYVGAINDFSNVNDDDWAIVHATQTIHYQIFGWNRTSNRPNKNHPNYFDNVRLASILIKVFPGQCDNIL